MDFDYFFLSSILVCVKFVSCWKKWTIARRTFWIQEIIPYTEVVQKGKTFPDVRIWSGLCLRQPCYKEPRSVEWKQIKHLLTWNGRFLEESQTEFNFFMTQDIRWANSAPFTLKFVKKNWKHKKKNYRYIFSKIYQRIFDKNVIRKLLTSLNKLLKSVPAMNI